MATIDRRSKKKRPSLNEDAHRAATTSPTILPATSSETSTDIIDGSRVRSRIMTLPLSRTGAVADGDYKKDRMHGRIAHVHYERNHNEDNRHTTENR
ncbi:hypothetical protein EVAR_66660_1 [Eumeta japonica]|uniref:Uncharacterized protein n=1 Tax=Eumeta variegata TaxID=151549 RepID=A0A4C1ZAQ0_EUMVA|nr:hypothetical protein EVAR_66660_1 [Eumeta japonica]